MPIDPELLDPYQRLIQIRVEGRDYEVPENNSILRMLQYLDVDLYPCRLCWNGECDNCFVTLEDPATLQETTARGCDTVGFDGMTILRIPKDARWPRRE